MLIQPCRIEMLGHLRLIRKDAAITRFATRQAAGLLAYLAYHPQSAHPREQLADVLWPEAAPEHARQNLRQALASLRRQIEPPDLPKGALLLAGRTNIGLNPAAIRTDVAEYEAALAATQASTLDSEERIRLLTLAIACYRGDLLPGRYEEWALAERRRLQETYLQTLSRLTALCEEHRLLDIALHWAQRALEADAAREETHLTLIRLYARDGQRAQAHRQYQALQKMLRKEFDASLDPENHQMVAQWLDASPPQPPKDVSSPHFAAMPVAASNDIRPVPPVVASGLPVYLTRFCGRQPELESLRSLLRGKTRLLTLTGPGGIGKTRLAVEVARGLTDHYGPTITFVPLQDICDPHLIAVALADALGIPHGNETELLPRIADVLNRGPCLLLIDNFEQLVDGGTAVIQALLQQAMQLRLLITSRRILNLDGEQEFALEPLPTPSRDEQAADPGSLLLIPAVALFVDRMQAKRPDFQITANNAGTVAALCARLEGIPLAMELAAGWTRTLTPAQMLQKLERRFDLLVSDRAGVSTRHVSLWATMDTSYCSLSSELQQFFTQLSVFRGGWTAQAAEAVCREPHALQRLRQLQDRSLIFERERGGTMRFHMLETLKDFAGERLGAEEGIALSLRHTAYFLQFVEQAQEFLPGADGPRWLDHLEADHDNLRHALAWCREQDTARGLRLAGLLYWFWCVRGHLREGQEQVETMLERAEGAAIKDRAIALQAAGQLANCRADNGLAMVRYREALALFQQLNDGRGTGKTLSKMGNAACEGGDAATGYQFCAEGLAILRGSGDKSALAQALFYYGNVLTEQNDYDSAETCFAEALAIRRQLGNPGQVCLMFVCMGALALLRKDYATARSWHIQNLRMQQALREPHSIIYSLRDLAAVAAWEGQSQRAARLMGAMEALRCKYHFTNPPAGRSYDERTLARIRQHLDEKAFTAEWTAGHEMNMEEAIEYALADGSS